MMEVTVKQNEWGVTVEIYPWGQHPSAAHLTVAKRPFTVDNPHQIPAAAIYFNVSFHNEISRETATLVSKVLGIAVNIAEDLDRMVTERADFDKRYTVQPYYLQRGHVAGWTISVGAKVEEQ